MNKKLASRRFDPRLRTAAGEKYSTHAGLLAIREEARRRGKAVVFTNGCFDVLHAGHVRLFRFAKSQGDILIVAVNSDVSVRANKGPGRPVFPLRERLEVLRAVADIDHLTSFSSKTPLRLIKRLRPDVLIKGADWAEEEVVGRSEVERAGGRVLRFPYVKGMSSTGMIRRTALKRKPSTSG
jgi:rfaE bifunctional protein nucleotidyltransferase chain/domain